MVNEAAKDKQTLAPLLLGGVIGSMLGFVTAKSERIMSERGHVITGAIVGSLLGALILDTAQKVRKK